MVQLLNNFSFLKVWTESQQISLQLKKKKL